jgi:hypothetical protein
VESGDYAEAVLWSALIKVSSLAVIFLAEFRMEAAAYQPGWAG